MLQNLLFTSILLLIALSGILCQIRQRRNTSLEAARSTEREIADRVQDLLACGFLIDSGFCSLGTIRSALQRKASERERGKIVTVTPGLELLLRQGAITSRQGDAAQEYSRMMMATLRS